MSSERKVMSMGNNPRRRIITWIIPSISPPWITTIMFLVLLPTGSPKMSMLDPHWDSTRTTSAERDSCLLPLLTSKLRGGMDFNRFPHRGDQRFPYGDRPFPRDAGWSERGRKYTGKSNGLIVKGLVQNVNEQDLIDYFDKFGSVTDVNLLPSNPRYPLRMAFVKFLEPAAVLVALDHDRDTPSWNAGNPLQIISQDPQFHEDLRKERAEIARREKEEMTRKKQEESRMQQQQQQQQKGGSHGEAGRSETPRTVGDWFQVLSRSTGRYYWMNKVTKETTWNLPPQAQSEDKVPVTKQMKPGDSVKTAKKPAKKPPVDSSSSDEDACDSEGYMGEEDRRKLAELPMLDRELILSERLEQRETQRHERRMMKRSKAKLDDKKTPAKADPKAKGKDKSSAAYKLGNEVVGKKIRVKVQEDGHLIQKNGLVVQVKEVEGSQHHRIVWNDGSDDSWLILQEHEVEFVDQDQQEGKRRGAQKRAGKPRTKTAARETIRKKELDTEHGA